MKHSAQLSRNSLSGSGTGLRILAKLSDLHSGHSLAVETANNLRLSATVVTASKLELVLSYEGKEAKFLPWKAGDDQLVGYDGDKSDWTHISPA